MKTLKTTLIITAAVMITVPMAWAEQAAPPATEAAPVPAVTAEAAPEITNGFTEQEKRVIGQAFQNFSTKTFAKSLPRSINPSTISPSSGNATESKGLNSRIGGSFGKKEKDFYDELQKQRQAKAQQEEKIRQEKIKAMHAENPPPPGLEVGMVLMPDAPKRPLPRGAQMQLEPRYDGSAIYIVGHDVILLDEATNQVLDVINKRPVLPK